ncbi:MAG: UDP-N-acetylglucosamine 2-epimerase (hydrolyzing) [Muribaculaceae bacterium]|nr:UDP-N-acetylglucosamine 2-epimerase (hydrolyzing) [Muribaculaceae bacterium]
MKKICFITGTRADYGILSPVMKEIAKSGEATLQVIATNMHLSPKFGMTVDEIEKDGIKIDARIESLVEGDGAESAVESMGKVQKGLAEVFPVLDPDMVVILGDRYEALAAAASAVAFNIPVAHLHGGETTEGAIDNKFRHAITQLADYHFAATPQYVDKIVSMGINPERVYHSGAPGAEALEEDYSKKLVELFYNKTGIHPLEKYLILAMHPVTMLEDKGQQEVKEVLKALDDFIGDEFKVLVTGSNSDPGNQSVSSLIENWVRNNPGKAVMVSSLGSELFHFAMDHAAAIVGNSSAALIEAPTYRLPAVNVGIRQKGRAHGCTVIDAGAEKEKILQALKAATSLEMKSVTMGMPVHVLNPYYKADSAKFIAQVLIKI